MVDTILLTEKCLLMLSFLDIVQLHTTVTLGSQKKTTLVVEIQRDNGGLSLGPMSLGLTTEVLKRVSKAPYDTYGLTFVGRYNEIISDTFAVAGWPFFIPIPFAPMGESIIIGVAMSESRSKYVHLKTGNYGRRL